ncbi:hypothetical protein FNV43_RR24595 [Rhamnella rubrinervis]|uniref:Uncharacterized protein n=1 Tax=Rhamnella rubrinervis TaxID=2594499 RepID=A0A8K0DQU5_9ROSA|nr:hypothetical protein FNV43_RR24595 [Rhamnella rubrinervis]
MGLRAVIAPRTSTNCQNLQLYSTDVHQYISRYNIWSSSTTIPLLRPGRRNSVSGYGKLRQSSPFFRSSRDLKGHSFKQPCNASFDEFSDNELSNQIEESLQRLNLSNHEDENNKEKTSFSSPFPSMEVDILQPSVLGIKPDPPTDWPKRREIIRYMSIERKTKSVELPLSIRKIKMKQKKLEESFREAGEFTYCSVNKAFSSMVIIVRELQSYALSIRGSLYCENLEETIRKVQREINASFVWLFAQVFSRTPSLMIYVMVLLANFSVYSMANNAVVSAMPLPMAMSETLDEYYVTEIEEKSAADSPNVYAKMTTPIQYPSYIVQGERYAGDWLGKELMGIDHDEKELSLWKSMVKEASRMQAVIRDIEALDHETMKRLVAPVSVEIEADDRDPYFRTDLSYQIGLLEDPHNPLLLFNYAQFLYLVAHDHDRAEDCFRRAVQVEQPDALALSQYAEFLWMVRKDYWGAEERYLEAMAAEPKNRYHASKYANFLWSTGGKETCFPLDYDNFDKDFNA